MLSIASSVYCRTKANFLLVLGNGLSGFEGFSVTYKKIATFLLPYFYHEFKMTLSESLTSQIKAYKDSLISAIKEDPDTLAVLVSLLNDLEQILGESGYQDKNYNSLISFVSLLSDLQQALGETGGQDSGSENILNLITRIDSLNTKVEALTDGLLRGDSVTSINLYSEEKGTVPAGARTLYLYVRSGTVLVNGVSFDKGSKLNFEWAGSQGHGSISYDATGGILEVSATY